MHVYEPLNARTTTTLIAPLYRDGCTYVRTTRMYNISSCLVTSFTSEKETTSLPPLLPTTHPSYISFLPLFYFFPPFCRRRRDRVASRNGGRKKKDPSPARHILFSHDSCLSVDVLTYMVGQSWWKIDESGIPPCFRAGFSYTLIDAMLVRWRQRRGKIR